MNTVPFTCFFSRRAEEGVISILQKCWFICQVCLLKSVKSRMNSVQLCGMTVQEDYCPSQIKANKNWLSESTGRLKKVLQKSVTINNLLSIGMEVRRMWRGGRTGYWGMSLLLMALRSGKNTNPHSCFSVCLFVLFFYGEDGCVAGANARDYNTWGLTFFYISLISTRVVKWVLSNVGKRLTWIYSNFYQECWVNSQDICSGFCPKIFQELALRGLSFYYFP